MDSTGNARRPRSGEPGSGAGGGCILLANVPDGRLPVHERCIAGVRRFAKAAGRAVVVLPESESSPAAVADAVARLRPAGIVVLSSRGRVRLPPGAAGSVPVAWLDPERPVRRGAANVMCDNAAVARLAFEELSAGHPPAYAVVTSRSARAWNAARLSVFRDLCRAARKPCAVFRAKAGETRKDRAARLAAFVKAMPARCAVFAANDNAASEVAAAARVAARAIPREMSLVGADGDDRNTSGDGDMARLSSIKIDFEQAGFLAAKALERHVAGGAASGGEPGGKSGAPRIELFSPLMVLRRESTRGFGRREPWILDAVATIRAEACEGLEAAALAARFPVSRSLFDLRFREAMGRGAQDEILHVRLEQALALLARPDIAIGAVAARCGFRSSSALAKIFARRYGVSMRSWRKSHVR